MSSILLKNRQQKRKRQVRKALFWTFTPVFLAVLILGALFFVPQFVVKEVTVAGTHKINSEALMSLASNILASRVWGIFPRNRVFFVPINTIREEIIKEYPQIESASVSHIFPHTLSIKIEERSVWALYCKKNPADIPDHKECMYINNKGVAFSKAPQLEGEIVWRIIQVAPLDGEIEVGTSVIDESTVHTIDIMQNTLSNLKLKAREFVLDEEYSGSLAVFTDGGWKILLEKRTEPERAAENLILVLEKQISNKNNLEYIDLRFPDKVFFKMKQ